jgi:CheY-like chemotaxis protein
LRLEVQDDGHGMTEEVRAHACDAFFTTRANRRGLGLLAVVNCVIAHRGAMEIASTPGRGTRVSVWIPAGGDSAQVSPKLVAPVVAPPASRVLVIDDDELIRCVATRALQHAHFAVVASPCGREGLAMFQRARGTWAAILLDLTMPDLRGENVLRWLRELDVNVPVLLTSGMQDTRAHSEFRRMGANGFIAKPFGAIELVEAIRRIAVAPEPQP